MVEFIVQLHYTVTLQLIVAASYMYCMCPYDFEDILNYSAVFCIKSNTNTV